MNKKSIHQHIDAVEQKKLRQIVQVHHHLDPLPPHPSPHQVPQRLKIGMLGKQVAHPCLHDICGVKFARVSAVPNSLLVPCSPERAEIRLFAVYAASWTLEI
jgi:hypothetical protein